jgi:hypothetical protein
MNETPTNQQDQQDQQESSRVHVTDIDTFVRLLFAWHDQKVAVLEHVLEIPEGVTIGYNDENTGEKRELELNGDIRQAFILGITLGLMELGTLPFHVQAEDVAMDADAEGQGAPDGVSLH